MLVRNNPSEAHIPNHFLYLTHTPTGHLPQTPQGQAPDSWTASRRPRTHNIIQTLQSWARSNLPTTPHSFLPVKISGKAQPTLCPGSSCLPTSPGASQVAPRGTGPPLGTVINPFHRTAVLLPYPMGHSSLPAPPTPEAPWCPCAQGQGGPQSFARYSVSSLLSPDFLNDKLQVTTPASRSRQNRRACPAQSKFSRSLVFPLIV